MSTARDINVMGIGHRLKQTQHILRVRMDDALRPLALTTPQYAVLSQLERSPGSSNAALARASFITAQTMHGIISNLEKSRLLKRKRDPHHGRILCTELTKQGHKVVNQAHDIIHNVEESMTQSMNQKNRSILEKLLIECVNNLNMSDIIMGIEN